MLSTAISESFPSGIKDTHTFKSLAFIQEFLDMQAMGHVQSESISMYYTKFDRTISIIPKILSTDAILIQIKGLNSVETSWKIKCDSPELDFVKINVYTNLDRKPSI